MKNPFASRPPMPRGSGTNGAFGATPSGPCHPPSLRFPSFFPSVEGIKATGRVLLGIALLLSASAGPLRADDLEDILGTKSIRVGVIRGANAPLLIDAADRPGGLEGELVAEIARRMDVRMDVLRTARTPDELIAQVTASQVDLGIGQLTDSLEWAKSVRFSKPYLILQEVRLVDRLAAAQAGGVIRLLADPSVHVAAPAGSIVLPAAREEFGPRLAIAPDLGAAIDDVVSRRVAAAIGDEVAVLRWIHAHPAAGIRLELDTRKDRRPGLAMAVAWKSDDLQAWLNLCLEKLSLDGTLSALVAKHLGGERPATHP